MEAGTTAPNLTVRVATLDEWTKATEWANGEGWNIGYQDPACFLATDPDGFFIGYLGDRPISAVSCVNYSDDFAVMGNYLVEPEFRGRGYGLATFDKAMNRAGQRVVSADAMPNMLSAYGRVGMKPFHDTIMYVGRPARSDASAETVLPAEPGHLDAIADYDGTAFPARRATFLKNWLFADGHIARVRLVDGRVAGYGVIRPAPQNYRMGPLVADTVEDAAALFAGLVAELDPSAEVSAFAPERDEAMSFFTARGMSDRFRVVRVYIGPEPQVRADRIFATASLELG